MGHAAAVPDHIQPRVTGHQPVIQRHFHVVELYFHSVQKSIVVGGAGANLVQRINHLNDAVHNALGQHQTQVSRGGRKSGPGGALLNAFYGAPAATDQITEPLDDDAASQHIAQPGNALAIAVAVFEGLGKMLAHQQCKVGIGGAQGGILKAVAVGRNDAVGIFVDYDAVWVHAEGAHTVFKLLRAVYDLAFIQLVGHMGEDHCRQLYPYPQIHPVGKRGDLQFPANLLQPFASAAAYGNNTLFAGELSLCGVKPVAAAFFQSQFFYGSVEIKIYGLPQFLIQVLQNDIVDIRAQVADGGVQQEEPVLQALLFEAASGGRKHPCTLAPVADVDIIYIAHELHGRFPADVGVQGAAKIVGQVVFSVGEGACAAESAHDGADLAVDAALDLYSVNGAAAFFQGSAGLKDGDLQIRPPFCQLIGGKDTARPCANDDNVILLHKRTPYLGMKIKAGKERAPSRKRLRC